MTGRGKPYCLGRVKRCFDVCLSMIALVLLAPLLAAVAFLVLIVSGPPIFFLQERVGQGGRIFRLFKFRTMKRDADRGLPITGSGDRRVTGLGRVLRATKIDELPQLLNVVGGSMSVVGPRPEVPRFVALYDETERGVLQARPGLTDPATVYFRDEETLLGAVDPARREAYYASEILPLKLEMNLKYLARAGFWFDAGLIIKTLAAILMPRPPAPTQTRRTG